MTSEEKKDEPKPKEWHERLREPFGEGVGGKLFKAYDKDQSRTKPKAECKICGSYHTTAPGVHLDYVGHGAVTDRLLSVDPEWNWEPLALGEGGLPRFVLGGAGNPLGLWIKLTIKGVTRLGYGSVDGNAFEAEKQLIGDAIRNAAMRFGVALDLWATEKLESQLVKAQVPSDAMQDARSLSDKANKAPTKKERDEEKQRAADAAALKQEAEAFDRPLEARMICGLPVFRTWESMKGEKIGKHAAEFGPGVPSSKLVFSKTWEWASEGSDGGERALWLEALIAKARDAHEKNPTEPLHLTLQAALLAYDAMQARISPPPEDKEATCPVSAEEV